MSESNDSYEAVKKLAQEKREFFGIKTGDVSLSKLRSIYKKEGIRIDQTHLKIRNLRAAYFCDSYGCSVLLNKTLPKPAKIFSLTHELKHHYLDKQKLETGIFCSLNNNREPLIEKTAEVFAAEFIWPQEEFLPIANNFGVKVGCSPTDIVYFKRRLCLPISYKFLQKRLEWFNFIGKGQYKDIKFQKLEREIFGVPFYLRNRH